jgi:hypothetical protein
MTEDRPIWLTSLAEADRDVTAPESVKLRLDGTLRRRRWGVVAKRAGLVGAVAMLGLALWLPAPKRGGAALVQAVDDSLVLGMTDATDAMEVAGDDGGGEFIPTMLASEQPLESVRVVRVSMPGAALARYGITSGDLTRSEEVTADLLVGQDGIARAIRVVK